MSLVIRTLSDQLVSLVRDRILSGKVPPNSPIRQDALASELGISKIPLREALTRLELEGLVQSHTNRGYFVSALTGIEAEEVYALRLKLEPDAVAKGAQFANSDDHREAEAAMQRLLDLTKDSHDSVGPLNRAFHVALIKPGQQNITVNFLERLHILSERYVRKHLEPFGRDKRAKKEHRKMLEAWIARDLAGVHELTVAHIAQTLDDLRQQLRASA